MESGSTPQFHWNCLVREVGREAEIVEQVKAIAPAVEATDDPIRPMLALADVLLGKIRPSKASRIWSISQQSSSSFGER